MITICKARGKWIIFNEYNWDVYGEFKKLEDATDCYIRETWERKESEPFGWFIWFKQLPTQGGQKCVESLPTLDEMLQNRLL